MGFAQNREENMTHRYQKSFFQSISMDGGRITPACRAAAHDKLDKQVNDWMHSSPVQSIDYHHLVVNETNLLVVVSGIQFVDDED